MQKHAGKLMAAACLALLAGCTDWPGKASGGMSELRPPVTAAPRTASDVAKLEKLDKARVRLACEKVRLDGLVKASSEQHLLTGMVLQPLDTSVQATREIGAGMAVDAEASLDRLAGEISGLEPDLLGKDKTTTECAQ